MKIIAKDRNGNEQEITDLYWFEENWIHNFNDKGYEGYSFRFECNDVLNWTTEPPTKPGFYWAILKANKAICCIEVGSNLKVTHPYKASYGSFTHYLGPLPIPEPPKTGE